MCVLRKKKVIKQNFAIKSTQTYTFSWGQREGSSRCNRERCGGQSPTKDKGLGLTNTSSTNNIFSLKSKYMV